MLSFSSTGTHEYCCTIVKVPEVNPIEGSDFLGTVEIAGQNIVVRKDQVKEGDIMLYASNECQLDSEFLKVNNLFQDPSLNANYPEWQNINEAIQKSVEEGDKIELQAKLKGMSGYFNKAGRVRTIKLKGVQSFGFLFTVNELVKYCPKLVDYDFSSHVNEDFDTIDGKLFVQAYVPQKVETSFKSSFEKKRNKRLKRFDTIIPGEFMFHYDTQPLGKNIEKVLLPDNDVTITAKLHGTSVILANVKCKIPKRFSLLRSVGNVLAKIGTFKILHRDDFNIAYRYIWSSRSVIKNRFINKAAKNYYDVDVWSYVAEKMKAAIPEGWTVYGEIVGYLPGTSTFIQKGYDYGCKPGECKLMPYRITTNLPDTVGKYEWDVEDVRAWTEKMMRENECLHDLLIPIDILWHGEMKALFPEIAEDDKFSETAYNLIVGEFGQEMFGLEKKESLCKSKVPREGIVLRIDKDSFPEAFKYKSVKFMTHEAFEIDKGEKDIEMENNFSYNQ